MVKSKVTLDNPLILSIILVVIVFFALIGYLTIYLQFDSLISDPAAYWQDSLNWIHPYNIFHVPAFPLILALLRGISFNTLPPLFLMRFVTLISVIVSVTSFYLLIKQSGASDDWAVVGSLIFILWPFVGLTYAVHPVADLMAIALYLSGLLNLVKRRMMWSSIFLGFSLVTHKALWPFIGITLFFWVITNWKYRSKGWLLAFILLVSPLAILWVGTAIYNKSLMGIITSYLTERSSAFSAGNFIFASLVGLNWQKSLVDIAKSTLALLIFILTTILLITNIIKWEKFSPFSLPIVISIILLYALFSYDFIFYVIRFSRLIVLPAVWLAANLFPNFFKNRIALAIAILCIIGLICTQFVMVGYLPSFFSN